MKRFVGFLLLVTSFGLQALTIGAYNIRNFDYDTRSRVRTDKPALAKILQDLNADVLSVEEINNTSEFQKFTTQKLPGYEAVLTNCGGAHDQRLGFLYNTKVVDLLSFEEDLSVSDPGGRGTCYSGSRPLAIGLFQVKATKQKFYGVTVHLKSGSDPQSMAKRARQYEIIKVAIKKLKTKTGVQDYFIAGDVNTTEYLNRGGDYRALTKVVKEMGMIDLSEDNKCSAYWWGGTDDGIETPSLLDHIIVTPGLLKKDVKTEVHGHCKKVACREVRMQDLGISYQSVSDHCPITANIQ
jgi:endonuclease/exonuclease/phosphatase family metal-dependent hydrolase